MAVSWRKDYIRYKDYFLDVYSRYKKKRDIMIFLEILLSLFTISVLALFALKPTAVTIIELVKEIRAKEEVIEKMDSKIRNLSTAQSLYSRESQRISILNQSLPNDPNPDSFQKQISAIYARNSVSLSSVNWEEFNLLSNKTNIRNINSEFEEGVLPITITASGQGSYDSVKNLITDLERLRRPLVIDTINTTPEDGENSQSILISIGGKLLYLDTSFDEDTEELEEDITQTEPIE